MRAVILAGGQGTRLRPYTTFFPKPLMPIGEMPILEVLLRQMRRAGVSDVTLTVNHLAEMLRMFFQDGSNLGLNIDYSTEDFPLGTAGPLSLLEGLDETFFVSNGDILSTIDMESLLAYHRQHGAVATIATHRRDIKIDLGVIQCNSQGFVTDYIEKPTYNFYVSMGIYIFEPGVLKHIPYAEYFDFPELVLKLIAEGEQVVSYPFDGYWKDLGRPDDYEQAVVDFEQMRSLFLPDEVVAA